MRDEVRALDPGLIPGFRAVGNGDYEVGPCFMLDRRLKVFLDAIPTDTKKD